MNRYDRFWAAHLRGAQHMARLPAAQGFIEKLLRADHTQRLTMAQIELEEWIHGTWLNEAQLFSEMSNRRQTVISAKRQEMEAMQRKKAVGNGRERVDAFAQNTHRAVGETGELSTYDQFLAMTQGKQTNILFSNDTSDDILMGLSRQFLALDPNAKVLASPETFEVSCQLRMPSTTMEVADEVIEVPGSTVTVNANLFQGNASSGDGLYIIDVERKAGDIFAFQKLFKMLKSNFQPVLEDNAEDPLDKDMEMI